MQVILVKSVRKLGKVSDTVNVKDGYGRNYLIPQELAIRATKDNVASFEEKKKELEKKNVEAKVEAEKVAKSLEGKAITFILQSAADGRLFGSVSTKLLAAKLAEVTKTQIDYSHILLESPIKFNGVYEITVSLHSEVQTTILAVIAKSDSEASDALRDFKEGKSAKNKNAEEQDLSIDTTSTESSDNA